MNFLSFIQSYEGKAHALPAKKISEFTGLNAREIRHIVERLRNEGQPIGSTKSDPVGYYWITTNEEMAEFLRELRAPFYKIMVTSKKMVNGWYERTGNQLPFITLIEAMPSNLESKE